MASLTSILGTDTVASSRGVINDNFNALNTQIAAVKTASSSVISSVLLADDELVIPIGANDQGAFRALFIADTAAAPDIKYKLTIPVGSDVEYYSYQQFDFIVGSVLNTANGGANPIYETFNGRISNGSVAGSIALAWAQNTNTPSSVTSIRKGSFLIFDKLN